MISLESNFFPFLDLGNQQILGQVGKDNDILQYVCIIYLDMFGIHDTGTGR